MMRRTDEPLTGRRVLIMLLGFFGLVVAVNGVFVYIALSSFSGLETENAYVKGLAYNETLRAAEAQKALGWTVQLDHRALEGGLREMTVSFRDKAGRPVDGLSVAAELRRPVRQGFDRTVTLAPLGGGRYSAALALPLAGQWDALVQATARDGSGYVMEQRLWLK